MIKKLSLLLGLFLVVFIADFLFFIHTKITIPEKAKLSVTYGYTLNQLSIDLNKLGALKRKRYFMTWIKLFGYHKRFQAGTYEISKEFTLYGLIQKIVKGKVAVYKFVIPEGSTVYEIKQALNEEVKISKSIPKKPTNAILNFDENNISKLEGWFFPDTYYYKYGDGEEMILQRAYNKMKNILETSWINRISDLPYKNMQEALVLASIIEKETSVPEEKPLIADILIKRLKSNMRLQADPTVIYGLGDKYKPPLKRTDLKLDSPYNTYLYKGLPPTPICSPGKDSIIAALNPAITSYYYFVSDGIGKHIFTNSLAEHNLENIEIKKLILLRKNVSKFIKQLFLSS